MRVGFIGATGIVGQQPQIVLAEGRLDVIELRYSASPGSVGNRVSTHLGEKAVKVSEDNLSELNLCCCLSSDVSRRWGPGAAARGKMCIDSNSGFITKDDGFNGRLLHGPVANYLSIAKVWLP